MRYLAALAGAGLVIAGGFLPAWQAYVAVGFLAAVLGLIFARAEQGSTVAVIESSTEHPLELGALTDQLGANKLMPMYALVKGFSGRHGYKPVTSAFIARLNNQRAVVLETN